MVAWNKNLHWASIIVFEIVSTGIKNNHVAVLPDSHATIARKPAPAIPESGLNLQYYAIEEAY